jgi:hypothetical protein
MDFLLKSWAIVQAYNISAGREQEARFPVPGAIQPDRPVIISLNTYWRNDERYL